jgi:hypothetical protein
MEIPQQRLVNQLIAGSAPRSPEEVVRWLGMVQAQDYLGALWAVGLRMDGAGTTGEAEIEKALAERKIVRTWPARGTLHFVAAEDARWLLDLLGPRVAAGRAGRHRQLGLVESAFTRSRELVVRALQGGQQITRADLMRALDAGGVSTAGQRGIHIIGQLALEGLICFGPRQGKQHTFVLFDEWLPEARSLPREQALAELARRYFTSHGPASLQDFSWWSGLSKSAAREGIQLAGDDLIQQEFGGVTYWQIRAETPAALPGNKAWLLPAFDEYLVGYTDRSAVLDPAHRLAANAGGGILNPTIVYDGLVIGTWKRTLAKERVTIQPTWFRSPERRQLDEVQAAAQRYAAFVGRTASLAEGQVLAG